MQAERLYRDRVTDQRASGAGQQQLSAMCRRGDPCGAVNLKPYVPSRATLDQPHMKPDPHSQFADLRRPRVSAQSAQRCHSGARGRLGVHKGGKERIALGAIDKAPLGRDCPADQRVMIEQGIEMRRPSRIFVRASNQDDHHDNRVVNVRVGGNAIEVMRGEVFL